MKRLISLILFIAHLLKKMLVIIHKAVWPSIVFQGILNVGYTDTSIKRNVLATSTVIGTDKTLKILCIQNVCDTF